MKIGVISNLYPPDERGGAELVASRVADELYRRGHKLFVISTEPFSGLSSLYPRLVSQDIGRVYRFYPRNLYHITNARFAPLPIKLLWHLIDTIGSHSGRMVRTVFNKEMPDLVLTHNLKGMGLRVSDAIQRSGVKQIHTLHDVQLSVPSGLLIKGSENARVNRSVFRKLFEKFAKKAIGTPDVIISPSKFLLDFYNEHGFFNNTVNHVIPNPAPRFAHITRVERSKGPLRLLFVGQLESHKGIQFLFETLDTLSIDFELHIVGDGSLSGLVEDRARHDQRIIYHGFVSLRNVLKLMAQTDAVVLPSLCYENSPTVIYEAFHVGTPVIAADIGGISELIVHGKNGLLFETGNKHAFQTTLIDLAQKADWFWCRAGDIRVDAERFSIKNYVDRIETLF